MKPQAKIAGMVFGRLKAISHSGFDKRNKSLWLCKCECGNELIVGANALQTRSTQSCGCYANEVRKSMHLTHGKSRRGRVIPEYKTWLRMKNRCYNEKSKDYPGWGGRGIKVCNRWIASFEKFLLDMGQRPSPIYSLERKNNNRGYSPSNCVWATKDIQSRNTRRNHYINHKGRRMIIGDWASEFNSYTANVLRMLRKKSFGEVYEYYKNKAR